MKCYVCGRDLSDLKVVYGFDSSDGDTIYICRDCMYRMVRYLADTVRGHG